MSRQINLQEYKTCGPFPLSPSERDALKTALSSITIEPASGETDQYCLTAGSTVGAMEIGDLSLLIQPKIGIPQLLSLACYAIGAYKPQFDRLFDYEESESLPDALALALGNAARGAFSRGLLHGYRVREEAQQTVRGRIRFTEQIRSRYGIAPPVEVRYQEFTDDILENRLIKAAAYTIGRLTLRSPRARRSLGWIVGMLDNVSHVEFAPRSVPDVTVNQLNDHYADAIALSQLILRHGAFESERGSVRASGFLMDMNVVFQEFVTAALREELRNTTGNLLSDSDLEGGLRIHLDAEEQVTLEPDLIWRRGGEILFVGDAKYKNLTGHSVPNADLYQLLAYATALNLAGGTLIYAQDEAEPHTYEVNYAGKQLSVIALDISRPVDDVLKQVRRLAANLKALRPTA